MPQADIEGVSAVFVCGNHRLRRRRNWKGVTEHGELTWKKCGTASREGSTTGPSWPSTRPEELTLLGRARLDIAAAKTRLSRLKAELGNEVYSGVQSGRIPALDDPAVQELCDRIRSCEAELSEREDEFERLRTDEEGTGGEEASEI